MNTVNAYSAFPRQIAITYMYATGVTETTITLVLIFQGSQLFRERYICIHIYYSASLFINRNKTHKNSLEQTRCNSTEADKFAELIVKKLPDTVYVIIGAHA